MQAFIVYAHPSENSRTRELRDQFIQGLEAAGHGYILSDLYKMNFRTDLSEGEYLREAFYQEKLPVPEDVAAEQAKINASDAIVFIYPVFWSDAPAKLKGWFDRVWTYGFAYGKAVPKAGGAAPAVSPAPGRTMKTLRRGLVLCSAGNTLDYFGQTGLLESMKQVMLGDRFFDRVASREFIVFEATSRENPEREANRDRHLRRAFEAGRDLFSVCP
jgi:NAD(P)H dehydrogenase (quinone)